MKVAFLGPAGTFSEEALRAFAPATTLEETPCATVDEAIMAVEGGAVDRAMVPIENSLEGPVTATLDVLAGGALGVRIAAEVVHPIRHCAIAREGTDLAAVECVVSHPQATAQCSRFLAERLPDAGRASAASTAEAVRTVAETDGPWAAIGTRLAAELYGCRVLAEGIEDRADNATRFVWLARAGEERDAMVDAAAEAGGRKTSIVFWGFNDASPGALVAVLRELADRGVNLTKIESRPRRVRLGHYMFFADLEGGIEEARLGEALEGLERRVETLRVLGSYPVA